MTYYKYDPATDTLQVVPSVHAPGYILTTDNHAEQTYPVDGWRWLDGPAEAIYEALQLAVAGQVRAGALDDDTVATISGIYPEWRAGLTVSTGDLYAWGGTIVECLQPHTTQADWTPDVTPALWKIHRTVTGAAPDEWVQPTGAQDVYQTGDRVSYQGKVWESTAPNNSWAPGVYGWVVVT